MLDEYRIRYKYSRYNVFVLMYRSRSILLYFKQFPSDKFLINRVLLYKRK